MLQPSTTSLKVYNVAGPTMQYKYYPGTVYFNNSLLVRITLADAQSASGRRMARRLFLGTTVLGLILVD